MKDRIQMFKYSRRNDELLYQLDVGTHTNLPIILTIYYLAYIYYKSGFDSIILLKSFFFFRNFTQFNLLFNDTLDVAEECVRSRENDYNSCENNILVVRCILGRYNKV